MADRVADKLPIQKTEVPQQDSERKKMLRGVLKTAALGGAAYGAYKLINKYGAIPPSVRSGSLGSPKSAAGLRAPSAAKTYVPGNSTVNLRPFDPSTLGQPQVPKPKSVIVPIPSTKRSTWYQPAPRSVPKDIAKRMPAAGSVIAASGPKYQGVMPQGRNTVDRLAKAAQLRKTRAYDALKPLSKPERRRLGSLIPGQVEALARVQRATEKMHLPGVATASERQVARQKLQLYRTAHLGATPAERQVAQQALKSQFPQITPQPVSPSRPPVMPQGRGSVERLAKAAQLRAERGYGGLKPFGKVEQRRLQGLSPREVQRLNKLQSAASGGNGAPKMPAARQKARQKWQIHRTAALGSATERAAALQKIKEGKLLEAVFVSARMFDSTAPNWDVRDERGRSARVFAPGARPRERREKHWYEKAENQRKLAAVAVVGSLLAGNAMGWKMRGLHKAATNAGDAIKSGVKTAAQTATNVAKSSSAKAATSVVKEPLPSFADNIVEGPWKKAMAARIRLKEFGGKQQFIGEDGRFLHPLKAATGYQKAYIRDASGGKREVDVPLAHGQVIRSAYNTAKTANKYAGRAGGLIKDTGSVIRGEPRQKDEWGRIKKREWEKPWFKRTANAAVTTGGLLLAGMAVKRGQDPRSALHPYVKTGENAVKSAVKKANQHIPDIFA
jgi:hypothetical protein